MNATEEWLRYIESKHIMQQYNIKGYSDEEKKEESEEKKEETDE